MNYYQTQEAQYTSEFDQQIGPTAGFYLSPQPTFTRQPVSFSLLLLRIDLTNASAQKLNYHLYTQSHPEIISHNYFISDDIREELQKRSEIIRTAPIPGLNLPDELQGYHTLVPLEAVGGDRRKFGNWYSTVYKATNGTTGVAHALRRIESKLNNA